MARKRKSKFTITGDAAPGNPSDYACVTTSPGEWKKANRNLTDPSDREGWGATNVTVFVPNEGSKLCAPEPPFSSDDGSWNIFKEVLHQATYEPVEGINEFTETYRVLIEQVATNRYPEDPFLSFEWEMKYFYGRLREIPVQNMPPQVQVIHYFFCGACMYFRERFDSARKFLNRAATINQSTRLRYVDEVISILQKQLLLIESKDRILIIISPSDQSTKEERAAQGRLFKQHFYTKNYFVKRIKSPKYTLDEIATEISKAKYVFFVGHGAEYFMLVTKESLQTDDLAYTLDVDLLRKMVGNFTKPKLIALLSCAYVNYVDIANSGEIENFVISTNSGDEHSEILIKSFIRSLDYNNDIEHSIRLSRLALLCRFSGENQIELYNNGQL